MADSQPNSEGIATQSCEFPKCRGKNVAGGLCEAHRKQRKSGVELHPLKSFRWTEAELQRLRKWYEDHPGKVNLSELEKVFGRGRATICKAAKGMGLTNSARTWEHKKRRKYDTREELLKAIGESTKRHIAANGHPRGMKGKKHAPETLAVIAEKSRLMHENMPANKRREMDEKGIATKIAKYGTAGNLSTTNAYSRTRGGKRPDLGNVYFRSAWEANYARYLNWLMAQGKIVAWRFEAKTFVFPGIKRGCITYTPDFEVTECGGEIRYHEIKGWMDKKSKTKLKRMKKYYPEVPIVLIAEKDYRAIARVVSSLLPGWEGKVEAWKLKRS